MDLVFKFSTDYSDANTSGQIINPNDISFTKELENSGNLTFKLPLSHPQISEIIEQKKVAVYSIESGSDVLIWSGYISEIENDFAYATVRCQDEKDFLRNKMIFVDKTWNATNMTTVLTALTTEANARKGASEGSLSFSTGLGATNAKKDFVAGTSYFDILKEIAAALDAEWTVSLNVIMFETTIGTDRTISGANYLEFIWNKDSPNENNITSIKTLRKGSEIATRVYGKDPAGATSTIVGDTSIFGSIERSVAMDDGNVATQTQEYINKHEVSQIEREFTVNVAETLLEEINVGDLVVVKIIHGSVLVDANENLKIIQQQVTFENKKPTITLKLSTSSKEVSSMANFLSSLNRRVKRFELY